MGSLLGTWSGPGWEAGKSNVYQVVSTIMFMIFGADHPYYMEPSYGGWEGTVAGRTEHERRVIDYDEEVIYHSCKYAILKTIERWMKNGNYTEAFRKKMAPVVEQIKKEF